MKKLVLLLGYLLVAAGTASAQDCTGYYYAQPGADIEMSLFDRKGNPSGRVTYHVKEAKRSVNALDAILSVVTYDEKNKEVVAARDLTMQCRNGTYLMDMKNFVMPETMKAFGSGEVKFTGSLLEYPSRLSAGTALPEATMQLDPVSMPMMKTTLTLSNRKVEGQESVTTPAGTFDCYKITYDGTVKSLVGVKFQAAEWYKPGFGVVRSETYRNGKLVSSSVLSKVGKGS